jgi:undecaprenyl-diphosphatase
VKLAPAIFAALLAAGLAWRWRRLSNERRAIGAVLAAGFAVYGSGLVHPPNIENLIEDVGQALGQWTYLLVGVMAFLETGAFVGLIAPGEFTILLGGVVAGQGEINVLLLIAIVWTCAVAGDVTSFLLGGRLGRGFLVRHGPKVGINEARLRQVEGFFAHHGGKTILIGRFVGLVRAIAPFIAGASRMRFRRFIPFDIVGAGLWGSTFVVLGFVFWHSFDKVVEIAKRGAFALSALIALVVGSIAAYRYLRVPENRVRASRWLDEKTDRPGLRPLAGAARFAYRRGLVPLWRVIGVPARFVWHRLTPGELGLELTTLLAVALVGGFVFGALCWEVAHHRPLRSDGTAFDTVDHLRVDAGVDVAKVLTQLGSLAVVAPLALVSTVYLAARRRAVEAGTLAVATILTVISVHVAKAATDRPRPSGSLVQTDGSSFPSGHAAYAIALVAIAVALSRALPRVVHKAAVVTVAIVAAAAIGLSRVYLGAHYLSDVSAGWGLAAALFAVCGMVALLVAFLRHNARAQERA